jgi:hypothetical protein
VAVNVLKQGEGRKKGAVGTLVAFRASSTRSFFSDTSTSLLPPTFRTATPPLKRASRSFSFSLAANQKQQVSTSVTSHKPDNGNLPGGMATLKVSVVGTTRLQCSFQGCTDVLACMCLYETHEERNRGTGQAAETCLDALRAFNCRNSLIGEERQRETGRQRQKERARERRGGAAGDAVQVQQA